MSDPSIAMPRAPGEREIIERAIAWLESGFDIMLVTVISTFGSAPRPVGSMALVREDGQLFGSVSGGCVEKRLAERFSPERAPIVTPMRIDDDEARAFGLTCGGRLELLFERPVDEAALYAVREALASRARVVREVDLESGAVRVVEATSDTETRIEDGRLRQVFGPSWRLVLIGAGQLSRYVASFAVATDFDVRVVEPRAAFRAGWPFPEIEIDDNFPDEAVARWGMDPRSGVLALTHDPALDDTALEQALAGDAFYIGALGSMRSHAHRLRRLGFLGVEKPALTRIRAPVGVPIGSRTAAEIALSIVSEAVRERASCRAAPGRRSMKPTDDCE